MLVLIIVLAIVGYVALGLATAAFLNISLLFDDLISFFGGGIWPITWVMLFFRLGWELMLEIWD